MPAITIGGFLCYVTSRSFMYFVTDDMKLGYWYLFVLAFFYLLLTPFRLKLKCDKLVIKVLIDAGLALGVWIVLFLLSRYVLSKNITNILSLNSCYNLWPFFILSYLLRKGDLTKEIMRRNWIFSVSLLSYVSIKLSLDNGLKMHFIPLIMSFCAIMSLFCLFGWRENKHTVLDRQLGLIGRNTLDIYIYHYFLLQMISLPLLGKWISSTGNYFIEGVLLILLSLSIAYASIVIGKTIKKSHWLGKVVYGRFSNMIPKIIHYCWLSNDPMPAELKRCIKSWKRKLPDYKIKKWDTHNFDIYSIPFVAEACKMRKWAFACDYIRVYALYTEGGIYMDSDVFVRNSLDFCLANRAFSAVECYPDLVEIIYAEGQVDAEGNKRKDIQYIDGIQIQAAILGAEKGHPFMRDCMNYYHDKHFILPDGSLNNKIISPFIFANIAIDYGFKFKDEEQDLKSGLKIYSSSLFASNMELITEKAVAIHCCAGSWRWMPSSSIAYAVQYMKEIIKNILFRLHLRGGKTRGTLK